MAANFPGVRGNLTGDGRTAPSGGDDTNPTTVGKTVQNYGDGQQRPQNSRIANSAAQLAGFVQQNSVEKGTVVEDRSGAVYSQWPVRLVTPDPYDKIASIRQQTITGGAASNAAAIVPGQGVAILDDNYFNWVDRKQDQYQYAKFKSWFLAQIDLSSPEKAAYWKNMAPQIYQERRELFNKQMELTSRVAKINMLGPEDEDDYKLIWMVQNGMITLPDGPAWAPQSMPKEDDFVRGMFSVKRIAPEIVTGSGGSVKTTLTDWRSPFSRTDVNADNKFFTEGSGSGFFGGLQNFVRGGQNAVRFP